MAHYYSLYAPMLGLKVTDGALGHDFIVPTVYEAGIFHSTN